MSKVTDALRAAFCRARAVGVTHLTRQKSHERPKPGCRAGEGGLTENSFIIVWTSDEVGEHDNGRCGDEENKDTPPPNRHFLLLLYEVPEKE